MKNENLPQVIEISNEKEKKSKKSEETGRRKIIINNGTGVKDVTGKNKKDDVNNEDDKDDKDDKDEEDEEDVNMRNKIGNFRKKYTIKAPNNKSKKNNEVLNQTYGLKVITTKDPPKIEKKGGKLVIKKKKHNGDT